MSLLNKTISFTRSDVTKDALGGEVRTFAAISGLGSVRASIQQEYGTVVDDFARRGIKITHAIYSRTNLSSLRVGDKGTDGDGATYVVRYADDMAGRGKMWCVYTERLS